jgi:hypothetical protein
MLTALLLRLQLLALEFPLLLLAAKSKSAAAAATTSGGKSDALPWAIVLFCTILALLVSLNPSRRTYEIKHAKEE